MKTSGQDKAECFFSTKTQFENIGDALINREMMNLAAAYGRVHLDLSRCPPSFAKTLGVDKIGVHYNHSASLFARMLSFALKGRRCYYFLSPGGYIGELKARQILAKTLYTFVLLVFWLFGVRLCLIGVSYERIGPIYRVIQRLRSHLFYRHIVRDELSWRYAQKHGFKVHGIMPDLAFNIFPEQPKFGALEKINRVALSFRTDQYASQKEHVQDIMLKLAAILPRETEYVFVTQVERDLKNSEHLKTTLEKQLGREIPLYVHCHSIEECLKIYATCDLVATNRLHALLMGASQNGHGIAVISEGKNEKIEGILSALNMRDSAVWAENATEERLSSAIQHALLHPLEGHRQRRELHNVMRDLLQAES